MDKNLTFIGGIVVIVVIIAAGAYFLSKGTGLPSNKQLNTSNTSKTITGTGGVSAPIFLTDPPYIPAGAQALIVSYSSLMVHTSGGAGSGWVNAAGNGTLDLLSVVNSSKVIGYVNVSANSTINIIRLNITSAKIIINGTAYNITISNGSLNIPITGSTKINTTAGVLLDISPIVSAVYNQNSTSFVLASSARAVVVSNVNSWLIRNIGISSLNASVKAKLRRAAPNITISSASISTVGNSTLISVTVKDNSNQSATLNDLFIQGGISASTLSNAGSNTSVAGVAGGIIKTATASGKALGILRANIAAFKELSFVISPSGSLTMPVRSSDFQGSGYILNPGSGTLTFNGAIMYNSGAIHTMVNTGSQYVITVIGQGGAVASAVVTAS